MVVFSSIDFNEKFHREVELLDANIICFSCELALNSLHLTLLCLNELINFANKGRTSV